MEELRESERVELKREVCEGVKRSIVAFANSEGGRIYVGVDDSGQVVGVAEPDADMLRVTSMVRDGICSGCCSLSACARNAWERSTWSSLTWSAGTAGPTAWWERALRRRASFCAWGRVTPQPHGHRYVA